VVWIYRLGKHKTSRHGIKKAVPIVGEARKALEPFLNRDPNDYCFKPAESEKWHRQQRTLNRKTPPSCGNRVGSTKSSKPRTFKECFDKDVYRRAIERAAKKAKVDHWFPYQLRHMAATEVRDALGIEAASALLGHSRTDMSEHYAKIKEAKAIEAAKVAPQLVF
jgi:integrase